MALRLADPAFLGGLVAGPTDPYWSNVALLLQPIAGGSIVDVSPSPKALTLFGNTSVSTISPYAGGASIIYDGDGDYTTSPVSTAFEFDTGDFTAEAQVYISSFSGQNSFLPVVSLGRGANGGVPLITTGWMILIRPTIFSFYRYDGTTETELARNFTFALNTWYHVAASRVGSLLYLSVNGQQLGAAFTSTIAYNRVAVGGSQDLHLGRALFGTGTYYQNGNSIVRITKGVGRYSGNFTPVVPFPTS